MSVSNIPEISLITKIRKDKAITLPKNAQELGYKAGMTVQITLSPLQPEKVQKENLDE